MKKRFPIQRLATDGVLIAMYFALSFLAVEIAGVKITFAALPVLICAALFGPLDGFLVALLGGFAEQMLKYGFSPTTALWILPDALRGLIVGSGVMLLCGRQSRGSLMQGRRLSFYVLLCLLSGVLVSLGNTFAYYVDSKMLGYYAYNLIFGVMWLRVGMGMLASAMMAAVSVPIIVALSRLKRGQ